MMPKHNITIDDIARDLGVSKTTVSRAISGKGRISEATRKKVTDYIAKCNYRPSAAAKGLAESRTYNLALVLPKSFIQLDLPFFRQALNAICEEAFIWDYNVLICLSTEEYPESLLRTLDNRKVDGVILSRTVENDELIDLLTQREIPFATLGSLPPHSHGKAAVEADHDQSGGCCAFSRTILSRSKEKIALLGNDMDYIVNRSRMAGFQKAVLELSFPKELIFLRTDLRNARQCRDAVRELLSKGVRRFLALDDDLCLQSLRAVESAGLHVPEDVRLYSFFDSVKLEKYPIPALRFDSAELGQTACRELLRCLRDEVYNPMPILGYRIIER